MSMYNDIVWDGKGNKEQCEYNSQTVAEYASKFPRGHWSFLGPGSEQKWYETFSHKPDGSWDRMAEEMMKNFSRSAHPIFRASSAFERGELRSKGGRRKSIHFNGSTENIELLLRTVISANQLSIYGAIADLCDEIPKRINAPLLGLALEGLLRSCNVAEEVVMALRLNEIVDREMFADLDVDELSFRKTMVNLTNRRALLTKENSPNA